MNPIKVSLQHVFIECLQSMLNPLVRLTLHCGLGHSEFAAAVRRVFIEVASEQYGVRGRPANISRVAAKTGLPRKVVSSYRSRSTDLEWSPDNEVNPINTIIHYWRFDDRYCYSPGNPRELHYEGDAGFVGLAKRYAGDIPASTIRQELLNDGIAEYTEDGLLALCRYYSFPEKLDEDFLRNAAFSIKNHAETLVHNALLVEAGQVSEKDHREHGWFERIAWSRRLTPYGMKKMQLWARDEGTQFLERAVELISQHEVLADEIDRESTAVSGVGLYFF